MPDTMHDTTALTRRRWGSESDSPRGSTWRSDRRVPSPRGVKEEYEG